MVIRSSWSEVLIQRAEMREKCVFECEGTMYLYVMYLWEGSQAMFTLIFPTVGSFTGRHYLFHNFLVYCHNAATT